MNGFATISRTGCAAVTLGVLGALPRGAHATPSTNFWTPATAYVQPFGVLHVTYDSYFRSNAAYPIDVGLEIGVLPWHELQLETGVDVFYPTLAAGDPVAVPILLNAKVGAPEDAYFASSPGWSLGVLGVGFEEDVTDYNMLHLVVGKTLPAVGTLALGGYYGLNQNLFIGSDGESHQLGLMASWTSPSIDVPVIDHISLLADVQTGNNAFGAAGFGAGLYFTPAVDLLLGPVIFFEPELQPGGGRWMWSVQLDIDIDLKPAAPAKE